MKTQLQNMQKKKNTNALDMKSGLNRICTFSCLDDAANSAMVHFDDGDVNGIRRLGAARFRRFSGEVAKKRTDSRPCRSATPSDQQRNGMRVAIVSAFPQLTKLKYKKAAENPCRGRQFSVRTGALT